MRTSVKFKSIIRQVMVACFLVTPLTMHTTSAYTQSGKQDSKEKNKGASLYQKSENVAVVATEKSVGNLYAPPPNTGGGDGTGQDMPVGGHEILFFTFALAVYGTFTLRKILRTQEANK